MVSLISIFMEILFFAKCSYGKLFQLPFEYLKFIAKEPLELIPLDVLGVVK